VTDVLSKIKDAFKLILSDAFPCVARRTKEVFTISVNRFSRLLTLLMFVLTELRSVEAFPVPTLVYKSEILEVFSVTLFERDKS